MTATKTTRPTHEDATPKQIPSAGSNTSPQTKLLPSPTIAAPAGTHATQPAKLSPTPNSVASAGSNTSPQATGLTTPSESSPAGTATTQPTRIPATSIGRSSAGSLSSPQAKLRPAPTKKAPAGSKTAQPTKEYPAPVTHASAEPSSPRAAKSHPAPRGDAPLGVLHRIDQAVEADPAFLSLLADIVDDLERVRIANENRYRHLTRAVEDSDGEVRGLGLDERNPYVRRIADVVAQIADAEHQSVLALQGLMRRHPLGPWVKATVGVGEKQAARLLATIGDPYIRPDLTRADGTIEPSRPRTVSELWAFSGLHVLPARQNVHDTHTGIAGGNQVSHPGQAPAGPHPAPAGVAPKRQKGQRSNWSTLAKTRAYLIAESCMKAIRKPCLVDKERGYATHVEACTCSPFRVVYDAAKAKYADAVHDVECVRCGPKGKPAQPGSALSDGHKHARAMRIVSKELLKELWRESKRIHETSELGEVVS